MFESFLTSRVSCFYALVFAFLLGIFLIHYTVSGLAIYGDGIGYYAHLHTWVFDADWRFDNEYTHIYSPANNNADEPLSSDELQIVTVSPRGVAANHFFPGTALLILPFYVFADLAIQISNFFGGPGIRNGFSDIYQIFVGIGVICYVTVGLHLLEKLLIKLKTSSLNARLVILAILFTSPLLYYGAYDVINSHGVSFFLSCWFFYEVVSKKQTSGFVIGVIVALAMMVRIQDGALAIIFLFNEVIKLQSGVIDWKKFLSRVSLFFIVTLVTLMPLYIYWFETFGAFSNHTYIQAFYAEHTFGTSINWLGSLLQMKNGLFAKSPFLLMLLSGYVYLAFKHKKILVWQFLMFFIMQYFIITIQGGWTAAAFGGRMYISSLPFFAVVFSLVLQEFWYYKAKYFAMIVMLFFALHIFQIGYFVLVSKEAEQQKTGIEQRTRQRLRDMFGVSFKTTSEIILVE